MKLLFIILLTCTAYGQLRIEAANPFDRLQITFSEAMDSSVLNVKNYTIKRYPLGLRAEGIAYRPRWVEMINDSIVIVHTNLHPAGEYIVFVDSVYDLAGNLINPFKNYGEYTK